MIPAFSTAMSAGVVAEVAARGRRAIGVITATAAVGDVGGVPGAAHARPRRPRRRPGRRRTRRTPSPTTVSKNDSGCSLSRVDELGVRRDVGVGRDERSSRQRLAVEQIRSVIDSTCGLVNRPVRSPSAASSVSIIRRRGGLAVGAGQVDDRVGLLRVAEQVGERLDAVERRVELGLGPAREQGALDLGVGLGVGQPRGRACRWPWRVRRRCQTSRLRVYGDRPGSPRPAERGTESPRQSRHP